MEDKTIYHYSKKCKTCKWCGNYCLVEPEHCNNYSMTEEEHFRRKMLREINKI